MQQLTGKQIAKIQEALLDAYPARDDLRMMVRIELNETLEAIADGANQRVVIFNLVSWAERTGRSDDLVQGAYRRNQGNPALQQLLQTWRAPLPPSVDEVAARASGPVTSSPASIDVFLSYSRKDSEAMRQVQDTLRAAGLSVWTDEGLDPGTQSWKDAISEAVKQAQAMVALLSPNSAQSAWVKNEIGYAQTHTKRVFPILIAGDAATAVPIDLINAQWVDGRENLREAVTQTLLPSLRDRSPLSEPTTPGPIPAVNEDIPHKETYLWDTQAKSVDLVTERPIKEEPMSNKVASHKLQFWAGWITLNCLGGVVGMFAGKLLTVVAGEIVVGVVVRGLVLGAVVGASQWILLRRHLSEAYWWRWILASALGMGAGVFVGWVLASTFDASVGLAVVEAEAGVKPVAEVNHVNLFGAVLGGLGGVVFGFAVGASQLLVLPRQVSEAYWWRWILANVLGMAVGVAAAWVVVWGVGGALAAAVAAVVGEPVVLVLVAVVSGAMVGALLGTFTANPMFNLLQCPRLGDTIRAKGGAD